MTRTPAIRGGKPIVSEPIKPLVTVVAEQEQRVISEMLNGRMLLSGYLAGSERGGSAVQRLEEIWAREFGVDYAIACNSGTSALLAACAAVGVRQGSRVIVPTMGMSAVAAAPRLLGANIVFRDVDDWFCLDPQPGMIRTGDVVIAINLFGHPAQLKKLKQQCTHNGAILIEDACQSPFATENSQLCGTIGDLGCFSYNVHKAINAGEGGMVVTNNDLTAKLVRAFVNHAEMSTFAYNMVGLNLRMTELTAVLVMAQIESGKSVVKQRQAIWDELWGKNDTPTLKLPKQRLNCRSACYCFPMLAYNKTAAAWAAQALQAEGVPCRHKYTLMHQLPYFTHAYGHLSFPRAEGLNDRLVLIELTSIDPTGAQIFQMRDAIEAIAAELQNEARDSR